MQAVRGVYCKGGTPLPLCGVLATVPVHACGGPGPPGPDRDVHIIMIVVEENDVRHSSAVNFDLVILPGGRVTEAAAVVINVLIGPLGPVMVGVPQVVGAPAAVVGCIGYVSAATRV